DRRDAPPAGGHRQDADAQRPRQIAQVTGLTWDNLTMMTCETCQAQLLHHLYGLLEESGRQTVLGHLAGCGACQAALAAARQQQQLLAVAAKGEFPDVRFTPVPPTVRAAALA